MVYQIDSRHSDGYVVAASFGLGMFSTHINALAPALKKPELLYPTTDTTGVQKDVMLSWKPVIDASFYRLEVSTEENFSTIDFEFDGLRTTEQRLSNLEQGLVKYYWRVYARGAGGLSLPSDNGSFLTAVASPVLSFPEFDAEEIELPVAIKWLIAHGADSYHLQISENSLFAKKSVDTIISENEFVVSNLDNNKRYFWRVSSIKESQEGLFSSNFRFRTKNVISVKDNIDNSELKIHGIYPNPIRTIGKLSFYIRKEEDIEIILYDQSGNKIRTISQGLFAPGEHSVIINANSLNNGTYYCVTSSAKRKITQKIIVLK
jgi:hypothetical protein